MPRGTGKDIILQAFHWNLVKTKGTGTMDWRHDSWYTVLKNMADEIAEMGFTISGEISISTPATEPNKN